MDTTESGPSHGVPPATTSTALNAHGTNVATTVTSDLSARGGAQLGNSAGNNNHVRFAGSMTTAFGPAGQQQMRRENSNERRENSQSSVASWLGRMQFTNPNVATVAGTPRQHNSGFANPTSSAPTSLTTNTNGNSNPFQTHSLPRALMPNAVSMLTDFLTTAFSEQQPVRPSVPGRGTGNGPTFPVSSSSHQPYPSTSTTSAGYGSAQSQPQRPATTWQWPFMSQNVNVTSAPHTSGTSGRGNGNGPGPTFAFPVSSSSHQPFPSTSTTSAGFGSAQSQLQQVANTWQWPFNQNVNVTSAPHTSGTSGFPNAKGRGRLHKNHKPQRRGHGKLASPSVASAVPNYGSLPPPPVKATPPSPPNWQEHYEGTIATLNTYKTFPIDASSQEFKVISELVSPIQVTSAEQIVNPDLWQRFQNTRKEMLRVKTDDLGLLSQLGFDDKEIQQRAHLSLNFVKDSLLSSESGKYSPNEALLFHCTRNRHSLGQILNQGLDERLSSTVGGRLGKGIYFADNPQKSIKYDGNNTILIFAVLLGDCLAVDHLSNKHSLVREPEKERSQKRTFNDQFFDSITARPKEGLRDNEYVIYNRYQCCPLYKIEYKNQRSSSNSSNSVAVDVARQSRPTVAWKSAPGTSTPMPNQDLDGGWPFFASTVFDKMVGASVSSASALDSNEYVDLDPILGGNVEPPLSASHLGVDVDDTNEKLATLVSFGFLDVNENKEVLQKYQNDLNLAVNYLLDNNNERRPFVYEDVAVFDRRDIGLNDRINTTTAAEDNLNENLNQNQTGPPIKPNSTETATVECHICYSAFSQTPSQWKELKCKHKLCINCYQSIETTGTTMLGVTYTSIRCPFCQELTGIHIGDCPSGKMLTEIISQDCEGFPGRGSIKIKYRIDSGKHHIRRDAFLPYTREGHEVLKLLKIAFDRRLIFVVGTSISTGARNVLVWNIHHKTALNGGVNSHGFPDSSYLGRVKDELKANGIE